MMERVGEWCVLLPLAGRRARQRERGRSKGAASRRPAWRAQTDLVLPLVGSSLHLA